MEIIPVSRNKKQANIQACIGPRTDDIPQCQKPIDGQETHVPDGTGAHQDVQSRPDDAHARRQRKISYNITPRPLDGS